MTEAQVRKEQAERDLRAANEAVRAEQQSDAARQLAQVRESLREERTAFQRLEHEIHKADDAKARVQIRIDELNAELTALMDTRPDGAEFLPEDEEVRGWQDEYTAVEGRLNRAKAQRDKIVAGMPSRLDAVKKASVIANLERSETNLLRKLRGESVGLQGGISAVR